jgi:hypothetical protein
MWRLQQLTPPTHGTALPTKRTFLRHGLPSKAPSEGARQQLTLVDMQLIVYSYIDRFDLKYIIKMIAQVAEPRERGER